ncbi:hypothetical protein GCM10022420_074940 [Streptomyces iranensis]
MQHTEPIARTFDLRATGADFTRSCGEHYGRVMADYAGADHAGADYARDAAVQEATDRLLTAGLPLRRLITVLLVQGSPGARIFPRCGRPPGPVKRTSGTPAAPPPRGIPGHRHRLPRRPAGPAHRPYGRRRSLLPRRSLARPARTRLRP